MQLAKYNDPKTQHLLEGISEDFPYPFLSSYHQFEGSQGNETAFLIEGQTFLPIRFYKRGLFTFLQILFPPLFNSEMLPEEEEQTFIKKAVEFIKKEKIAQRFIQPFLIEPFNSALPGSKAIQFGSYFLDLIQSEEEIFSGFQKRYQRTLRSLEKENVSVKYGKNYLADFYQIYKETMIQEGKFVETLSSIEKMFAHLGESHLLCAVSYFDSIPQAGLLVPYSRFGGYLMYGGVRKDTSIRDINKYLHWEVIKKLKSLDVLKCVMGGARLTDLTGQKTGDIQLFKERFGCKLKKGYLWKLDIDKKYTLLYDGLFLLKHLKPKYKDVIDQEYGKKILEKFDVNDGS